MRVFPVKSQQKIISDAKQFLVIAVLCAGFWVYGTFINPHRFTSQTVEMAGFAALSTLFKSGWGFYKASRM